MLSVFTEPIINDQEQEQDFKNIEYHLGLQK